MLDLNEQSSLEQRNAKIEEIIEYLKSREPNHQENQIETVRAFLENLYPAGSNEINVKIEEQETSNDGDQFDPERSMRP